MIATRDFTAKGAGPEFTIRHGEAFTYAVAGTFVGTVLLQQLIGGAFAVVASATGAAGATVTANGYGNPWARYRFYCSEFTSGTIQTSATDTTNDVLASVKDIVGKDLLQYSQDGVTVPADKVLTATNPNLNAPLGAVAVKEVQFTETAGAGVYTGAVVVPAGATILDIIVNAIALWNPATSAIMKVGDTDDDGFYIGVDLKATDLLAGESISFALAGGKAGAYIANSQVSPRYSAVARTINGIVTVVGGSGSTGRTRMSVIYALPVSADIVAATKV